MNFRKHTIIVSIALIFCIGIQNLNAQKNKRKNKKNAVEKVDKKTKEKTIAELTKKSKKIEGLFTMYRDSIDGTTYMLIKKDQIGKEFIYFSQVADGVTEARAFRGSYLSEKVFEINKHYNKIEFVTQNTGYYFDEKSALSKSSNANISEGTVASLKIEAKDEKKGIYLIKSDDLFLKETFQQIKAPKRPKESPFSFKLGTLSKEKSKIESINNYPENLNVKSHYVYSNPAPLNRGSNAVTDGRNVSVKINHYIINMPTTDYKARFDDPRVGYFLTYVNDMTTASATPYKDMIHRWNLVKKNPDDTLSEPVKPIEWWIENTTPVEFRSTVKEAVLEWNKAFEKAGFKNAIVVKTQPDDATWDAGDIRYNVLRWTSSPNPPFGGYGPSFVNPRTGEILGADIMLEYVYHTNRVKYADLFNLSASNAENVDDINTDYLFDANNYLDKHQHCISGNLMQENTLFGQTVLMALGANNNEMQGLKMEAMKELIMHEVGHTLGLNHNMKASQLFSLEELSNPGFIKGKCLTASVMDYTAINVVNDKTKQGQYYSTTVGPYDIWAIQYGYTPVNSDDELDEILKLSILPQHIFGNDADDMRFPGKSIDPRVMTSDLSNNQIEYSINRMNLVNDLMTKIKDKYNKPNQSYQELRQAYYILRSQYGRSGDVISRFIGGVYVDRSVIGQNEETQPFTPVSYGDQKRALSVLRDYVFAPNAFDVPNGLYNFLAMQRRGFNFFSRTEDPKIHNTVLSYQNRILAHLLHQNTLQRIVDSELYGNTYKLSEFMTDLNAAIFNADIKGNVNTFRQNLQLAYVKKLIAIVSMKNEKGHNYNYAAQSMALYNLNQIKKMTVIKTGDKLSIAHKGHLNTLISNVIKDLK